MFDLQVFNSRQYKQEASNPGRIVLVFDTLEQFRNIQSCQHLLQIVNFSDEGQMQQLIALEKKISPGADSAASVESFFFTGSEKSLTKVVVIVLPTGCSRHNSPARSHALTNAIKAHKGTENTLIYLVPAADKHAFAQICAIGRQFPTFSLKSSDRSAASASTPHAKVDIVVEFAQDSQGADFIVTSSQAAIENIRLCQKLVDTPPNILHSDAYIAICRSVAETLNCQIKVIQGKELEQHGFGGLYSVGKAAEHQPALVVLSYHPTGNNTESDSNATPAASVCLVGKGIIYDTGGLSIKTPTTVMAGMKMDMGGSAAVLGAFATAVKVGNLKQPLHALLCLAENSVGPLSTRPDDIYIALSGKSVEVNNTDAEGRLVLSDGVFYAYKHLNAHTIFDIATLTGGKTQLGDC
jgi:probable aminopeptidase NPEPL1